MSRIEQSLPPDIKLADGTKFRPLRATSSVEGYAGGIHTNVFEERNRQAITARIVPFGKNTTKAQQLERFLDHIDVDAQPFWMMNPFLELNQKIPCGPLADGSRTTFPISGFAPDADDTLPLVNGTQQFSGYRLHQASNILSDNQAALMDGDTTGLSNVGSCTIEVSSMLSAYGLHSVKVVPTGSVATVGVQITTATLPVAAQGDIHTAVAAVYGSGDFVVRVQYVDSSYNNLLFTDLPAVTGSGDSWDFLTVPISAAAPALTAYIRYLVYRATTSDEPFHVDCMGLVPGDLDRWYLPSMAPGAIQFDAAVTLNARVTASSLCYRMARMLMVGGRGPGVQRSRKEPAQVDRFSAAEVVEVDW